MEGLDTKNRNGLNARQVEESRLRYGDNALTPPRKTSAWRLYLDKYNDPIIRILLIAAAISLVLAVINNNFIETIGIIIAIVLATTVGFYFELDATRKFNILTVLGEEQAVKVRREGRVIEIPRRQVVVGDIVIIETGDEIPADGELLFCNELTVNESTLTGEPLTEKHLVTAAHGANAAQEEHATYPENLVLRSSMVMNGRAEYRVTAVGDHTEIGRVARSSTERKRVPTPLSIQLDKLARLISRVGSGISVAAFICFLVHSIIIDPVWHSQQYFQMAEIVLQYFMMAVTLIVMAVPEGLPMAVTLSLALNMRRMLQSNNLVRSLHASETMGAVTVICTDKTGTLTKNQMAVSEMTITDEHVSEELLATAIAVNSTAELDHQRGIGNPTEVALLQWLQEKGHDYRDIRKQANIIRQTPFSTERKYMSTCIKHESGQLELVKGAPEIIIPQCEDIDTDKRKHINDIINSYQQRGMRTLAFACNNRLQAVCAISDPLRDDVRQSVQQCMRAGIAVKMITGDNSTTAIEIARQIGIWQESTSEAAHISGTDFSRLSDEEAVARSKDIIVMSRARPSDKQRFVEALQKSGEVVAVTGDGTNDAPALHHAHIGLSLGSGTSVAKEASDITLLDDSFGAIANAVMWGRSLYKNIQRFLFFQLTVNITALILVLWGSLIGTDMPLTVTQILWINLIMDTFAALALASLPPSREVMNDKPRSQKSFIITPDIIKGILGWGILFSVLMAVMLLHCERWGAGGIDRHELTMFFTVFVMLQFWNLFNAKALGTSLSAFKNINSNKGLLFVLLLILIGQWLIVTFGGKVFRCEPLSWKKWITIISATSVALWIGELQRFLQRIKSRKA